MSDQAAAIVVGGFLDGVFDVFNAMLPDTLAHETAEAETMNEAGLRRWLEQCPTLLQGRIQNGLGAVALLLSLNDAGRLAARIEETEYADGQPMTDAAKNTLRETAESALGSGVTNLMQRFGRAVEQLEGVELLDTGTDALKGLIALMDAEGVMARFSFDDNGGFSGEGLAVCSASLVDLVPDTLLNAGKGKGSGPVLSQNEVKDILGGLDTGGGDAASGATPNLERVLDIALVAQARLGRVEMPINQLLTLGPGSVVDVGHLVDEPIELLINDKLIARGDVVVVDEKFGLRITEIVSTQQRIESLR